MHGDDGKVELCRITDKQLEYYKHYGIGLDLVCRSIGPACVIFDFMTAAAKIILTYDSMQPENTGLRAPSACIWKAASLTVSPPETGRI